MGGMALQTVCIDHVRGMGTVTFQAVQKGLVLFMAEGAVLLFMSAGMGLHLTALFRVTGTAGGFGLFHVCEFHSQGFVGVMAGGASAYTIMGRLVRSMARSALRDTRGSMFLMTVSARHVTFMARALLFYLPRGFLVAGFADRFGIADSGKVICKWLMWMMAVTTSL